MILIQRLHLMFRLACAMCYIGHGVFGIITKKIWCNYFAVFGIGEQTAYSLMPYIGIADIIMGLILIIYPMRFAAAWLVFWGLFTATLRPLSGEPFAELIERAGNFGAPLLLLMFSVNGKSGRAWWFEVLRPKQQLSEKEMNRSFLYMQIFGAMLLVGHSWLNLLHKQGLINQYASLGFGNPSQVATIIGLFEIACTIAIFAKPVSQLLLMIFVWKAISETVYPSWPVPEWVERGGSYGILLGLLMCALAAGKHVRRISTVYETKPQT